MRATKRRVEDVEPLSMLLHDFVQVLQFVVLGGSGARVTSLAG